MTLFQLLMDKTPTLPIRVMENVYKGETATVVFLNDRFFDLEWDRTKETQRLSRWSGIAGRLVVL